MQKDLETLLKAYQPSFPQEYTPGIGIIGSGGIVRNAHLPAYQKYGVKVVGVYDISPAALQQMQERFHHHAFTSLDELLEHPEVEVVDIAVHTEHRPPLVKRALAAGKHVLSQKPFAADLATANELVEEAEKQKRYLAVNQNGRWCPAWRLATLLIEQGYIGELVAATHLFDIAFSWIPSQPAFDTLPHFSIYDYSIHWIDIFRCWFGDTPVESVRAREYRLPNQPQESHAPWGMWLEVAYSTGASAMIRCIGGSATQRSGHPFWIHGTQGTIRGSALGEDFLELERNGIVTRFPLEGQWIFDGFGGTMGELLSAIAEQREPYNSARHNIRSLEMMFAACRSSELAGQPVAPGEAKSV